MGLSRVKTARFSYSNDSWKKKRLNIYKILFVLKYLCSVHQYLLLVIRVVTDNLSA